MNATRNVSTLLISVILMCCALIIVGQAKTEEVPVAKTKSLSERSRGPLPFDSPKVRNDNDDKKRQIPFQLLWSKIILPVRVNDSRELSIILDTGMPSQGLLLFDRDLADELQLSGTERSRIHGAGTGQVSYALKVESAKLSLSGVDFEDQDVRILQNDTMRGTPNDGVIGSTLFGSHVVRIDYDQNIITLFDPSVFDIDPSWETVNLTFNENNIPFLEASVSIAGDKEIDAALYIDLASSEALELLVKPEMKFTLPENLPSKYIGKGLDGHIVGQYGRVASLKIGSFVLYNVPTAFPKSDVRSRQQEADGILCNDALRRFNLIFDYGRKKLYIKPNSHFSEPFD
jgi:predicted aspartyl protease